MLTDPRIRSLADLLIHHSVKLAAGGHVLIETFDCSDEIAVALCDAAKVAKGHAHVSVRRNQIMRALNQGADDALRVWGVGL